MQSHQAASSNIPYDISGVTSKVALAPVVEVVVWVGSILAVVAVAALLS